MDKKFLIKAICFNLAWVVWIGLSVFFGYLIAKRFFPDNLATLIPFSLIFLVAGCVTIFFIYRHYKKKNRFQEGEGKESFNESSADNVAAENQKVKGTAKADANGNTDDDEVTIMDTFPGANIKKK